MATACNPVWKKKTNKNQHINCKRFCKIDIKHVRITPCRISESISKISHPQKTFVQVRTPAQLLTGDKLWLIVVLGLTGLLLLALPWWGECGAVRGCFGCLPFGLTGYSCLNCTEPPFTPFFINWRIKTQMCWNLNGHVQLSGFASGWADSDRSSSQAVVLALFAGCFFWGLLPA